MTKYRRNVITSLVLERLEQILAATALKGNCELQQCNGERNHIHRMIEPIPNMNLADFVGNLKPVSSRLSAKNFQRSNQLAESLYFGRLATMSDLV